MSTSTVKLRKYDKTKGDKEKLYEERYENIQLLFTISFIISDSLMIFDIVANVMILNPVEALANVMISNPVEAYFYMRFLVAFFGLYGTIIMVGGKKCRENFDVDFTCCCGKFCDKIISFFGCDVFIGGLFLIISYCVELSSIKLYYNNKDTINDNIIIWPLYLLFISSTITLIMFCFLIINMRIIKKIKEKYE